MPAESRPPSGTRSLEERVVLPAPADVVWRALTDAEELMRWFSPRASVEPGVGGLVRLSWVPGQEGSVARIEIWEPNRRLRTVEHRRDRAGRLVELVVDYFIQGEGAQTVLRVVHAGFGADADWDEEYDGTVRGWRYELRGLAHYLGRHRGSARRVAFVSQATSLAPEACYARVMGPAGLIREGRVAGLAEGDRYGIAGSAGGFEGVVLLNRPPLDFAGTATNLNDALLRYEFYGKHVRLWAATWGVDATVVQGLESGFRDTLRQLTASFVP